MAKIQAQKSQQKSQSEKTISHGMTDTVEGVPGKWINREWEMKDGKKGNVLSFVPDENFIADALKKAGISEKASLSLAKFSIGYSNILANADGKKGNKKFNPFDRETDGDGGKASKVFSLSAMAKKGVLSADAVKEGLKNLGFSDMESAMKYAVSYRDEQRKKSQGKKQAEKAQALKG